MSTTFDYVIVGAGTAGCVLANRLSADPAASVLLIEAGGDDRHPMIHVPAGFVRLLDHGDITWQYRTVAEPNTGSRQMLFPRGKVVGGSSSINGLLYVRPFKEDLDAWARMTDDSWRYDNVLPYYKKSEKWMGGPSEWRGRDGMIRVDRVQQPPEICHAAVQAGSMAGLTYIEDGNKAHDHDSIWYYQQTRDGRFRSSAARAYLYPARSRSNLTVWTRGRVQRLIMEGAVCQGVVVQVNGQQKEVHARRETILSAGVIGTPQILQVSGIGPSDVLEQNGIRPVRAVEAVGSNFQDHYVARICYRLKDTVTANERSRGVRLLGELMSYAFNGKGLLTYSAALVGAFYQTKHSTRPDVQYVIAPGSFKEGRIGQLEADPGISVGCWQMRPNSRGTVRIRSADVTVAPEINPAYLSDPQDVAILLDGMKFGRKLFDYKPLARYVVRETVPGADCTDDESLIRYARTNGSTVYHAVGTCAMGNDDKAVVDPQLRVRGISRLRIVDASVMPQVTSTNTNATVLMIAEKGAAMILEARQARRTCGTKQR
jgi:choline dehydrogenase